MTHDFSTHVVAFNVTSGSRISSTTQALVDTIMILRQLYQDFVKYNFFLHGTGVIIGQRRHPHPSTCRSGCVCFLVFVFILDNKLDNVHT